MRTEGAVLRQLSPGGDSPWRVLLKGSGDQFLQVSCPQLRQLVNFVLIVPPPTPPACQVGSQCVCQACCQQEATGTTSLVQSYFCNTLSVLSAADCSQVGQMKRRPTQSDLELAFINAKAAQSPLTSLVKGVRGIFDKGGDAKQ